VDGIRDISISSNSSNSSNPPSTTAAQNNRLPSEMLVAIFAHLSRQELSLPGCKGSCFVRDLVSVTHVCRFWRQAAINAPELWTEIVTRDITVEAIKGFLERSGELPLNVDLRWVPGGAAETDQDITDALVPHTHRFRQLSACVRGSIPFTKPAPLLERLAIRHSLGDQEILFDDQAPRLRELVLVSKGLWLQNQLGNLTTLHLTLSNDRRTHSEFLPFFDMLRRCPVLEEMFLSWSGRDVRLVPPQLPTVPLHHLRKLVLSSLRVENLKYFLRIFDLKAHGIVIHLSGVNTPLKDNSIPSIQAMFPNNHSGRPSLLSSTRLGLIFRTQLRLIIIHVVGPGFSIRVDLSPDASIPLDKVRCVLHDAFPSVRELWVRGSSRMDTKLYGIEHFTALERLVLIGRGSKWARNLRQVFSPDPSGVLPCPLLSTIDCYCSAAEMREVFHLVRTRSSAGRRLQKLGVPISFIPLPVDVSSCVKDVGGLDTSMNTLRVYSMGLPEFYFVDHEWWQPWKSGFN